jgi:hypothetical protein
MSSFRIVVCALVLVAGFTPVLVGHYPKLGTDFDLDGFAVTSARRSRSSLAEAA